VNEAIRKYLAKFKGQDLKARCARGSLALSIGTIIAKALALASKIILTHILAKNEIGLMVMIFSLLSFFETIIEIGVRKSVIQSKDGDTPEYLNMAWWFQGVRSAVMYLVAFLLSPILSRFYFSGNTEILTIYSPDELTMLLRAAFLYIMLNGFTSPKMQILTREFRFFKRVLLSQGTAAVGIIITIILAFTIRNVWALVIGNIAGMALLLLFSYIACPFKPKFSLHKESLASIYHYARGMAGLPILTYLAFNADILVLGKVSGTETVGMYGMALVLANVPRDLFNKIISPVLLPAFAERQQNKEALCRGILSLTRIIALVTLPGAALAAWCGKTILTIIYPEQYAEVAVVFGLLCFHIAIVIQTNPLAQVFFGIGKPGQQRLFVVVRAILIAALMYPAVNLFDLMGAAGTLLFANTAGLILQVWLLNRDIKLRAEHYMAAWMPGMAATVVLSLIIWATMAVWPDKEYVHLAAGTVACGAIITGFLLYQVRKGTFLKS
jgi:O-antigen/teichoic acid export membrane protein